MRFLSLRNGSKVSFVRPDTLVTGPASAVLARAHVRAHQRARVVLFRGPVHAEPPTPASPCEQHHPSRGTHARLLFTNIPTILREGRPSYPAATSRRPRPRRRCRLSRASSPRPRPARRHSPPAAVLRSPGRADKEEWDEVIPFFAEAEVAHVDVHIDPDGQRRVKPVHVVGAEDEDARVAAAGPESVYHVEKPGRE
jgi:hypothetical protein